eukprot:RCo003578
MHLPSLPPPALPPVLLLPPQLALWFLLWKYYPPPHHSKAVAPSRLSVSAAHPQPPAPVTRANRAGQPPTHSRRPQSPPSRSTPIAVATCHLHTGSKSSRLEPSNALARGSPLSASSHPTNRPVLWAVPLTVFHFLNFAVQLGVISSAAKK